jgi:hypothetical protein
MATAGIASIPAFLQSASHAGSLLGSENQGGPTASLVGTVEPPQRKRRQMYKPPKELVTQVKKQLDRSTGNAVETLIFQSLLDLNDSLQKHAARIKAIEEKLKQLRG